MTFAEKAELASLVLGSIVALLGGKEAITRGLQWWAAKRVERAAAELNAAKEVRLAQIHAEQNDAEREERTEARLWERVDTLDRRLDECEERHRESERRGDECERRSRELEEHVRALQDVVLRNDDTGRHLLEERSTPPADLHLPPVRRT